MSQLEIEPVKVFERKILGINFFDAMVTGAITIALPLLLLERNVDVSTIGIVFSILPVVFTFSRVLCASFADQIGFKKFYILNSIANFLHILLYATANSPFVYAAGKIAEGGKNAFIWAVNRSSVIVSSRNKTAYRGNSKINASRVLGLAIGSAFAGITIAKISFEAVFLLCFIASIAIAFLAFWLKKDGSIKSFNFGNTLKRLDFRRKSPLFRKTAFAMIFQTIATSTMLTFALPLFFSAKGFDFVMIGFFFAAYYFVDAATIYIALKKGISLKRNFQLQTGFYAIGAIGLLFVHQNFLLLPLILMAIGDSLGGIVWERLIVHGTTGSKSISVDIGWIHVPSHLANALGLFLAGFIIQFFGYGVIFILCALSFAIYTVFGMEILQHSDSENQMETIKY